MLVYVELINMRKADEGVCWDGPQHPPCTPPPSQEGEGGDEQMKAVRSGDVGRLPSSPTLSVSSRSN